MDPTATPSTQATPDSEALREVLAEVLDQARDQGATSAEASIGAGAGLNVTVRMGQVETIEHNRDKGLSVTVYIGHQKGSASSSDFSPGALADTVRSACQIASYGGSDEHAGLADPDAMATEIPDLDLYHPWALDPERAVELALAAEAAALEADERIDNSDGATVGSREGERIYANSHGFVGGYRSTRHSLSTVVIARDTDGMQRDHWYTSAREAAALDAPEHVGQRAAERTLRRLGARQARTGKVPVLYAAEIASSLVGHLIGAVSGGSLYRKASFLLDKLDQAVLPSGFRIHERPRLPRGIGSAPFDGDGLATRDSDIVSDGILTRYVLSAYSARRLGLPSTANAGGVRNVALEGPTYPFGDLLARMGTGLYVTELIGMGVNTVTGDYSRGASGFWVENGEIQYPVEEITIAGNLADMFQAMVGVGDDVDRRGNIATGSILVEQMMVAGA